MMVTTAEPWTTQPALGRAIALLAAQDATLAQRAITTLTHLLAPIYTAPQQDAAWRFSTLNGNGYPIEFTFSSLDPGLRYTVEVGGPAIAPGDRLTHAGQLLGALRVTQPWTETCDCFGALQAQSKLTWGAWLGVRHLPQGDRFKVYAEVGDPRSAAAQAMLGQALGHKPLLPNGSAQLVAVGRELGSSRTEFYFRIDQLGLAYWEIGYLLRRVGLESQQVALLTLVEAARGYTIKADRPPLAAINYGFSLSVAGSAATGWDAPPLFSLFAVADPFIGNDAAIRHNVLALANTRRWNLGNYAALTTPLANRRARSEHHNVIAFIVGPQGLLGLHISLSPPTPGG